jgi:signal transduction histidine kinase
LLAETLAFTDDPEKRAILAEQLASEASRMTKVVDDILTLARTESMTTEYVPVDVVAVLDEVASGLSSLASGQDISLVRGPVASATVNGDVVELSSAFRNLLLNAITYTNAKGGWGGSVTYRSSIVDDRVCIEVEDTGVGFPARYERRVFERFFRVDHSRGRQSGGTGLGLSIVKNVAVAHGGTVMAKSEVGVGSVFTICLPVMGSES